MELEDNMALLELNERKRQRRLSGIHSSVNINEDSESSDPDDESNQSTSRVLRKRIRSSSEPEKRRVLTKPKKVVDSSDFKQIQDYYLDKRVKRLPPNLETIFEEPRQDSDSLMSTRKFKRTISFMFEQKNQNPMKLKKRKMKVKRLSANKRLKMKKLSIELLIEKLAVLEEDP